MKYVDIDLINKTTGVADAGILVRDILEYVIHTKEYDFIIPIVDYVAIARAVISLPGAMSSSGRSKNDMPFFSIAGITFTMITEEEADKYRMLK